MSTSVPECGFVFVFHDSDWRLAGIFAGAAVARGGDGVAVATPALAEFSLGGFVADGVPTVLDAGTLGLSCSAIAASSLVSV
ncbi:MAG: hypothetical protein ACTSSR_05385, partial [Alphaproteobacteria bacterium]